MYHTLILWDCTSGESWQIHVGKNMVCKHRNALKQKLQQFGDLCKHEGVGLGFQMNKSEFLPDIFLPCSIVKILLHILSSKRCITNRISFFLHDNTSSIWICLKKRGYDFLTFSATFLHTSPSCKAGMLPKLSANTYLPVYNSGLLSKS